jgi:hypothetical protein
MSIRPFLAAAILLSVVGSAPAQQTGAPSTAGDPQPASRGAGNAVGTAPAAATVPADTPVASPATAPANAASMGRVSSVPGSNSIRSPAPAAEEPMRSSGATFVPPSSAANPASGTAQGQPAPRTPAETLPRKAVTRVTSGTGALPNESGQLYREYDISPYIQRVTTTKRPEQAIVDWILRETGYETWHSEPLAILSAGSRTLRVYHTAQVQSVVAEIVDRFNSSEAETQAFSLRVITLDSPNWRMRVQRLLLNPVPVQTQGTQAWMLEKEAAAALLAELRRRSDYREHNSPQLLVSSGQPTVVSATRGRNYVRDVKLRADAWPGFEPETAIVDEGFSLEFSPLLSLDGKTVDAAVRCDIDQVDRMVPVTLNVPTTVAPRQSTKIEVPQVVHFRFHERFRWPIDRILIIGMGVVAVPVPGDSKPLVPGLPLPFSSGPPRADLLLLVESRGKAAAQAPRVTRGVSPAADYYRGR